MKRIIYLAIMLVAALALTACGASTESNTDSNTQTENANIEQTADVDLDGDADVMVKTDVDEDIDAEITVEFDDQMTDETKEAIANADPADFCKPGSTYTYASADGSVDANIIGLTTYEGAEFCKATSTTVINTPVGDMTTDTTYYFDSTYTEYWVETATSGIGPTQTNKIHIVNGVVEE